MTCEEDGQRETLPKESVGKPNGFGISVAVRSGLRGTSNAPFLRGLKPGKALNLPKQKKLSKFPRQGTKVQKSLPFFWPHAWLHTGVPSFLNSYPTSSPVVVVMEKTAGGLLELPGGDIFLLLTRSFINTRLDVSVYLYPLRSWWTS